MRIFNEDFICRDQVQTTNGPLLPRLLALVNQRNKKLDLPPFFDADIPTLTEQISPMEFLRGIYNVRHLNTIGIRQQGDLPKLASILSMALSPLSVTPITDAVQANFANLQVDMDHEQVRNIMNG